jgi:phage protein D
MTTTTTAEPIWKGLKGEERFYVPEFLIRVRSGNPDVVDAPATDMPITVVRDIKRVTYKDSLTEIDSFELEINNWDAEARKLKYAGTLLDGKPGAGAGELFEPGRTLELHMGYHGELHLMMIGQVTTLEPSFPGGGAPSLVVHGLNVLHRFKKQQHTFAWFDRKPSDIARDIGKRAPSNGAPGIGIEVRISEKARDKEEKEPVTFMSGQFDIVFLVQLARRHGYSLLLREEKVKGQLRRYLCFEPSEDDRAPVYRLDWGISLSAFTPTLQTARQVSQVTVRGFNRKTGLPISGTAKWGEGGIVLNRDQQAVAQAVASNEEIVLDRPVHNEAEARAIARDLLLRQLKDMIKGSGSTVGLPLLRTGRTVEIGGLGARFSGQYYVTETAHTIGDDGYRTTFSARRERPLEEKTT